MRSGWLRGSIYWVLLVLGSGFAVFKTIIPDSQEPPSGHFRTLPRRPPSVDSGLLIIDSATASEIPLPTAVKASLEKNVELASAQGMEAVADHAIAASPNIAGRVRQGPEAVRAIRKVIVANSPVGYANTVQAILDSDSITDRLPQIKVPTLVLVGDEDTALPAAHVTHERIASSELVIIPNAGHLSNLEQPDAFNRAMLKFLVAMDAQR